MSFNSIVDSLNLDYEAKFVPFSQSRNSGDKHPSLNWICRIEDFEFSYMQGMYHVKGFEPKINLTVLEDEFLRKACEFGPRVRYHNFPVSDFPYKWKVVEPSIYQVLEALLMESEVLDYPFEEWCKQIDLNPDNTKDRAIYDESLQNTIKIRRILGDKFTQLRQIINES